MVSKKERRPVRTNHLYGRSLNQNCGIIVPGSYYHYGTGGLN